MKKCYTSCNAVFLGRLCDFSLILSSVLLFLYFSTIKPPPPGTRAAASTEQRHLRRRRRLRPLALRNKIFVVLGPVNSSPYVFCGINSKIIAQLI